MDAPTDEKLLQDYLAGNDAGFELLVRRHANELYQFVMRFTNSSMAADDVVQETFLKLHTAAATFDPKRRLKPWIFTIAANKARDFLRRRTRKREVPLDAQINGEHDSGQCFRDLLAVPVESHDEDVPFDEKRKLVRTVVEAMPDKLSEVLILAYFHRFPYREIAEVLEVPLGTVKSRLHAAVAHFGEQFRARVAERADYEW